MTKIKNAKNRVKNWTTEHSDELFVGGYFALVAAACAGALYVSMKQSEALQEAFEKQKAHTAAALRDGRVAMTDTGQIVIIESMMNS